MRPRKILNLCRHLAFRVGCCSCRFGSTSTTGSEGTAVGLSGVGFESLRRIFVRFHTVFVKTAWVLQCFEGFYLLKGAVINVGA